MTYPIEFNNNNGRQNPSLAFLTTYRIPSRPPSTPYGNYSGLHTAQFPQFPQFPQIGDSSDDDDDDAAYEETYYSDSNDTESDEDTFETMYQLDEQYIETRKRNNTYHIGCYYYDKPYNSILFSHGISPSIFFQFAFPLVAKYLQLYSIVPSNNNTDILKISRRGQICKCVVKTHWLRLVQRHWKNVYKQRKNVLKLRSTMHSIIYFEMHGRYPYGANHLPSLNGMMSMYKR